MPGLNCSMWDLIPWPGIEPGPPTLGAWSLSPWTSREIPIMVSFDKHMFLILMKYKTSVFFLLHTHTHTHTHKHYGHDFAPVSHGGFESHQGRFVTHVHAHTHTHTHTQTLWTWFWSHVTRWLWVSSGKICAHMNAYTHTHAHTSTTYTHTHARTYTPSGTSGNVWRHFGFTTEGRPGRLLNILPCIEWHPVLPPQLAPRRRTIPPLRPRNPHPEQEHPRQRRAGDKASKLGYAWCVEAGMGGLALSALVPLPQSWVAVTQTR